MKNYLIIILLLFSKSCQMEKNKENVKYQTDMKESKEYVKYQTLDEYKLMGVECSDIKAPYVLAKKMLDTIFVIKSNNSEKVIQYINKGAYWHSKSIIYVDTIPLAKQKLDPTVYEKFIFNDTVVEYKYSLKENLEKSQQRIFVHTKKNCIVLIIQDDDIKNQDDPYNEIKEFVANYKTIFPLYTPGYQPRCYSIYKKRIKGNVLYIYRDNRCVSSKEMNSLGEFDSNGTLAWWW